MTRCRGLPTKRVPSQSDLCGYQKIRRGEGAGWVRQKFTEGGRHIGAKYYEPPYQARGGAHQTDEGAAHRCRTLRALGPSEGPTGAHIPSEGPTGAYTPSQGAAQGCPILRGPHIRHRMVKTDTADRVGGENQWVMARQEAGMLEFTARNGARDVAVSAEVAVRGR